MTASRLGRISNQSLADQARELIRQAIFEGRIKPDERLTIERIAAEFGISRTPVREALKALESDGIVRLHPHRGAIVQRFDKDEILDRYAIRALLEGHAGELACRAGDPDLAADLERNCDRLAEVIAASQPDDLEAYRKLTTLNSEFHDRILDASGSATTLRLLETLQMPLAYRLYIWRMPERQLVSLDFHRRIAAAFRAGRPVQVRRLMEGHLRAARDFLVASA
jgi:GntR family transcriptional regulator, vanillate catabolism transcriptional regulator